MIIIVFCIFLLLQSFMVHLIYWRMSVPTHATRALLKIFFFCPFLFLSVYYLIAADPIYFSLSDIFRLFMLYVSCALVYIILYSAIELQSPTLAIVHYISLHGSEGCESKKLFAHLDADEEIKKRIGLMHQGGWIDLMNNHWGLTEKGQRMASLFENAAFVFGLRTGG